MKRTVSIILSLVLLLSVFSACGADTSEAGTDNFAAPTSDFGSSEVESEKIPAPDKSEETSGEAQKGTEKESAAPTEKQTEPPSIPVNEEPKVDKNKVKYCWLSIDCLTILDNIGGLKKEKLSVLPKDGIIFAKKKVIFYEGETVFDVLKRETRKNKIHMEFEKTPMYNSAYIEGIGNLYEFDCGEGSGWTYSVNGWFPNYGCSRYAVKDGDFIEWRFTCDLGRDVGDSYFGDKFER